MTNANQFALLGSEVVAETGNPSINWQWLYYVTAGLFFLYAGNIFLSPFKLFPTTGKMKYLWLAFESGIREEKGDEARTYDVWTSPMMNFAGIAFASFGMFFIWASNNFDKDFTFFTVLAITFGLNAACCNGNVFIRFRGQYNPLAWGWCLGFLVEFILAIIVNIQNDTDTKQLSKAGAKAGDMDADTVQGILWFFFAYDLFGALNMYITSFDAFEFFGAQFYLREGYTYTYFSKAVSRFTGTLFASRSVILFWAAYNFDNDSQTVDFDFPMAVWVFFLIQLTWFIGEFVFFSESDFWEQFAVVQATTLVVGFTTAFLVLQQVACSFST